MTAVSDVMTANPVVLEETRTLRHAAEAMRDRNIGDVLISDTDGALIGIVTDRDVTVRGLAEGLDGDADLAKIITRGDLATVTPDDDLEQAVSRMKQGNVKRVPVVTDGDQPAGILTFADLADRLDVGHIVEDLLTAAPNN